MRLPPAPEGQDDRLEALAAPDVQAVLGREPIRFAQYAQEAFGA